MTQKNIILNSKNLNILQKIVLKDNNTLAFYFGDTPNWRKNNIIKDVVEISDFYEVIIIKIDLSSDDLSKLFWKIHRYSGEEMVLEIKENNLIIWEGDVSGPIEYWGTFNDIEEEIPILKYEKFAELKSAMDWKTDFNSLRTSFHSLYRKKNFQIKEFREKIKQELEEKINGRIEQSLQSKKKCNKPESFTEQEVNDIVNLALDDLNNGIKVDLFAEFIYDEK